MNPEQPPSSDPESADTAMFRAFVDSEPEPVVRRPTAAGLVITVVGVVVIIVVVAVLLAL